MDSVLWNRQQTAGTVRRRFWCALINREVEVDFVQPSWFATPRSVVRCSAFDPAEAVSCGRRCVDSTYRRQWPFALPVH